MNRYDYDIEKIKIAVANNFSFVGAMRELGIPNKGGNHKTFKNIVRRNDIDTSHFDQYKSVSKKTAFPVTYYFENRINIQSFKLLRKLLNEGYKENRCEVCGITEWNGMPITLQLHHIDGDHLNNSLENLQVICPNCHSQTPNFRGNANKKEKPRKYCKECGKELKTNGITGLCSTCAQKLRRRHNHPSIEELLRVFEENRKNYCATARYYGVSDTCIRKWLKKAR